MMSAKPRGEAAPPAHARGRREVRPEGVRAGGRELLLRREGQPAVAAVQYLDAGAVREPDRAQGVGREARRRAEDLVPAAGSAARSAREVSAELRAHHHLAVVGDAREPARLAQRGVRLAQQRLRRPRRAAQVQHQARHAARLADDRVDEGQDLQLLRPARRRRAALRARRVLDADRVVGVLRQPRARRRSSSSACCRCPTTTTSTRRPTTR